MLVLAVVVATLGALWFATQFRSEVPLVESAGHGSVAPLDSKQSPITEVPIVEIAGHGSDAEVGRTAETISPSSSDLFPSPSNSSKSTTPSQYERILRLLWQAWTAYTCPKQMVKGRGYSVSLVLDPHQANWTF